MPERIVDHAVLEGLAASSPEAVIALDGEGRICLFNPAAQALFAVNAASVLGQMPADVAALAPILTLAEQARESQSAVRQRVALPDGGLHWVQVCSAPLSSSAIGSAITDEMKILIHELKRPVSGAKSSIDMIEVVGPVNALQRDFARRAQRALLGMLNQIHQLEDIAWMGMHGTLQQQWIDLNPLVGRALIYLEGYAQQQGVTIVLDLPADGCPIFGDPRRLENAIANLIHNAIKYSPDGGQVHVVITPGPERVELKVIDQGIGIEAEHLPRVFEETYRVHNATTAQIEGSGIGLAIVRTVVELHGGQVFASSQPGQGSTFGFWLPRGEGTPSPG